MVSCCELLLGSIRLWFKRGQSPSVVGTASWYLAQVVLGSSSCRPCRPLCLFGRLCFTASCACVCLITRSAASCVCLITCSALLCLVGVGVVHWCHNPRVQMCEVCVYVDGVMLHVQSTNKDQQSRRVNPRGTGRVLLEYSVSDTPLRSELAVFIFYTSAILAQG